MRNDGKPLLLRYLLRQYNSEIFRLDIDIRESFSLIILTIRLIKID